MDDSIRYDPLGDVGSPDPWAIYRRMREEAPLYYSAERDAWALSRFADVQSAARDWRTFSSEPGVDLDDTAGAISTGSIIDSDPPDHDSLRAVVNSAFTPQVIAGLEDFVGRTARELFERLASAGEGDFVEAFAWALPVAVAREMLGVPAHDAKAYGRFLREVVTRVPGEIEIPLEAREASARYHAFVHERIGEWAGGSERVGVLRLLRDAQDVGRITEADVLGTAALLGVAFTETTSGLLSSICHLLASHPDQTERLRAEPDRIPDAIEEVLRFEPPSHYMARRVTTDVELHGQQLATGSRIILLFAAANRDERRWEDPETLDLFRPRQRNLGFGEGIHHCIGAPVARMEARILARLLLEAKSIEVTGDGRRWYPTHGTRGWLELPVRILARTGSA
jgi:cytochrome P450